MIPQNFEKIVLPCGLRILLVPDQSVRSASVGVYAASGGRYETPETMGISHFIEHMLFKGTASRTARDIALLMDLVGGRVNAYTAKDYICAHARVLEKHLNETFELLCDILTGSVFAAEDVDTERGVILEELAMCDDDPDDSLSTLVYRTVWGTGMLGAEIIGTRETVSGFSREDLLSWARKSFSPEAIVISVCGLFDRDSILATAERYFGAAAPALPPAAPERAVFSPVFGFRRCELEQNRLCLCFEGLGYTSAHYHAMLILSSVCGGGFSSRLWQRLREQLGLVYQVDCGEDSFHSEGLFHVTLSVSPEKEKQALTEIVRILSEVKAHGVDEHEFISAKEQLLAETALDFESISQRCYHYATDELEFGRVRSIDDVLSQIEAVTLDEVNELANEIINFNRMSFCVVGVTASEDEYKNIISSALADSLEA